MKADLTDAMTKFLAEQVASGRYADASDVVREGIRRLTDIAPMAGEAAVPTGPVVTFQRMQYDDRRDFVLTPTMEEYVAAVVSVGLYLDESEVIRAGLRLLMSNAQPAAPIPTGPIPTDPIPTE